jgi:L-fuconolactonase
MNIDAHQHFWQYDPVRDQWITDAMTVLKRDYLPGELVAELRQNGIDATIAVQTDQSEAETDFLLERAARNDFIAGVIGWVDLRLERVAERLEHYANAERLVGFRHIVQAERDDHFLLQHDFVRGLRQLRQFGYTYDILIYPRQLPAAVELTARLPEQPFVLDHLGKPEIRNGTRNGWRTYIRELATHSNVCCKLSGIITEADWRTWTPEDCKPYLDAVFEAFGPERLMFGSDWPVCLLAGSYTQAVDLIRDYIAQCAPAEQEAIMGRNASRFYKLKTAAWTCN